MIPLRKSYDKHCKICDMYDECKRTNCPRVMAWNSDGVFYMMGDKESRKRRNYERDRMWREPRVYHVNNPDRFTRRKGLG